MKLAILISGRGSNMQSLVNACEDPDYPADVGIVISNNKDAAGLEYARQKAIPTQIIDHRDFENRESFEDAISLVIEEHKVDLICLAGFMRLLTDSFVSKWRDRIVNIHPSLLPAYKGLHTHERVLEDGTRFTGCTVHFVRPEMDDGPVILQAVVPVLADDTAEKLAARVLEVEHQIYPTAVKWIASGRTRVSGHRVIVTGVQTERRIQINPLERPD